MSTSAASSTVLAPSTTSSSSPPDALAAKSNCSNTQNVDSASSNSNPSNSLTSSSGPVSSSALSSRSVSPQRFLPRATSSPNPLLFGQFFDPFAQQPRAPQSLSAAAIARECLEQALDRPLSQLATAVPSYLSDTTSLAFAANSNLANLALLDPAIAAMGRARLFNNALGHGQLSAGMPVTSAALNLVAPSLSQSANVTPNMNYPIGHVPPAHRTQYSLEDWQYLARSYNYNPFSTTSTPSVQNYLALKTIMDTQAAEANLAALMRIKHLEPTETAYNKALPSWSGVLPFHSNIESSVHNQIGLAQMREHAFRSPYMHRPHPHPSTPASSTDSSRQSSPPASSGRSALGPTQNTEDTKLRCVIVCGKFEGPVPEETDGHLSEVKVTTETAFSPFFNREMRVFTALSDPLRRSLYPSSELREKVGCKISYLSTYLKRRHRRLLQSSGIFQAKTFVGKSVSDRSVRIGGFFLTDDECTRFEAHWKRQKHLHEDHHDTAPAVEESV
jgi:hypothetical protein